MGRRAGLRALRVPRSDHRLRPDLRREDDVGLGRLPPVRDPVPPARAASRAAVRLLLLPRGAAHGAAPLGRELRRRGRRVLRGRDRRGHAARVRSALPRAARPRPGELRRPAQPAATPCLTASLGSAPSSARECTSACSLACPSTTSRSCGCRSSSAASGTCRNCDRASCGTSPASSSPSGRSAQALSATRCGLRPSAVSVEVDSGDRATLDRRPDRDPPRAGDDVPDRERDLGRAPRSRRRAAPAPPRTRPRRGLLRHGRLLRPGRGRDARHRGCLVRSTGS